MNVTLKDLIGLTKELPEKYFEETFEKLKEIKDKAEAEKEEASKIKLCPHCGSKAIVRNGKRNNRQAYMCRNCDKTFMQTTGSAIANSHVGETVWKQVIRDTVEGISLDKTANSLDLHHSTVFNMRHKILVCLENEISSSPVTLDGVCELDETYVLESEKGRKFPENYHRKPRKRGGKASKRGLSDEQICIQTAATGEDKFIALTVNRATPTKEEMQQVFGSRITDDTTIICDGNSNYEVFSEKCTVAHVKHPNKVNGFHSFKKERIRKMGGIATIYQNRYNALFTVCYSDLEGAVKRIYGLMMSCSNLFLDIETVKSKNLCNV
jgi:transposase-like protein